MSDWRWIRGRLESAKGGPRWWSAPADGTAVSPADCPQDAQSTATTARTVYRSSGGVCKCAFVTEFTTALVAGLIGLIGTGIGAAATAWAAKIGATKNIEAVHGQVQDQAANEHSHWLRQQRLASYEGFLDAWDACTRKRKDLAQTMADSQHDALRAELRQSALHMMERARHISLLGPEEVSQAAEVISKATQENVEKEDKYGQYVESTLSRIRDQERQLRDVSPNLQLEDLREALRHVDDLGKLQEMYSVEQLEWIVDHAERSMREMEDWVRGMAVIEELGCEFNEKAMCFLEDFQRNLQATEESRVVFIRTVRDAIASRPQSDDSAQR